MFRIGIVGSDNSHGLAFAKLCNFENQMTGEMNYPDLRITAIYGHDKEHTEKVAKDGAIERVVENADELMGLVDAVMVIFRHGSLHAQYALPFIKAGMPVWVDKPFTADNTEAIAMIEAAKKSNALITGGSTTKYTKDVLTLKYAVENDPSMGAIKSGYMNFPGDIKSEYSGIFFYGPHLVEMMLNIFGKNVKSVISNVVRDELVVIVNYEAFHVILDFTKNAGSYRGIVYGANKTLAREIDISAGYKLGFDKFYEMLKTKEIPHPIDDLAIPVKVLSAINSSIEQGKEVYI